MSDKLVEALEELIGTADAVADVENTSVMDSALKKARNALPLARRLIEELGRLERYAQAADKEDARLREENERDSPSPWNPDAWRDPLARRLIEENERLKTEHADLLLSLGDDGPKVWPGLISENHHLQARLSDMNGVNSGLVARNADLQARLTAAEAEVEKHANNDCIRELEQMVEEADERGNALSARLSDMNGLNSGLVGRNADLQARLSAAEAENASLVDKHNRESHGTMSHEAMAYDDLQARLDEAVREVRRLVQVKADLQQENERLKADVKTMDQDLFDLRNQADTLQARLSAAEEERDRAIQSCAALRAGKEQALSKLRRAEAVVEAAKGLVIDNDGWCYRCEKEQTHGDTCPLPRLIDAIRQYEEGR